MPTKIAMPRLALSMVEGRIVEWCKSEGDFVEKDEILYVLETEKTTYEVPAPTSGILAKIIAKAGDTVQVGEIIGYMVDSAEKWDESFVTPQEGAMRPDRQVSDVPKPDANMAIHKIRATPRARRIAEINSISLKDVEGSGPGGRVAEKDVIKFIEETRDARSLASSSQESKEDMIVPASQMRKTIARRMCESVRTIPHYWVIDDVDATELTVALRTMRAIQEKEKRIRLTYTDFFAKLVSQALAEYPHMNAAWTGDGIRVIKNIDIGIAVDVPSGLIVPVIRQVEQKSLSRISIERESLVARGREGKLLTEEMSGSTFTINNVGGFGIRSINAIINPPECAILTIGSIAERVVAKNGEIMVRPVICLSLGCDHRIVDGAYSSRFMARCKELIENPLLYLSLG